MKNVKLELFIYGAGGFAREVDWLIESSSSIKNSIGFIKDNAEQNEKLNNKIVYTLMSASAKYPAADIVIAVANSKTRKFLTKKKELQNFRYRTIIHDTVKTHESTRIGEGSIICAGNHIMPDVTIGRHVHINLACTIGHDATVGDFTTVSPGVRISGNVVVGRAVFIGTGACIIQGTQDKPLIIEDGTVIAAGACITKSTVKNGMYAGVPAVRKK